MNPNEEILKAVTRRHFFHDCGVGLGAIGLTSLLNENLWAANQPDEPMAVKQPHFPAKAKRVVYMHMAGAPSQLELFDNKPVLKKHDGSKCPDELFKDENFAFIRGVPKLLGPRYEFHKHGKSGQEISTLLPHLSEIADDITIVRSMFTDQFNHAPAQLFMQTGFSQPGRPSMGSWLTYGLGSENQDLPGFVVLVSERQPDGGKSCWSSGFLPSVYQGVEFRSQGDPVLFVSNPDGVSDQSRRMSIDTINELNSELFADMGDPEITTRISQYELAYKMQHSVPGLMDISEEPEHITEMYGIEPGKPSFANNCLLARRLLERGVRFIQLYHWGWDSHGTGKGDDLMHSLPHRCQQCDQASAALVKDLKQRGMLDDTIVIWGGEFGRTPMNEERNRSTYFGRDHHPHSFSMWMAGGGLKPGFTLGKTDDLGHKVIEDPVNVHDLHATVLHLLGMDHKQLIYRFQGRDYRLTDVFGNVVDKLIA